MTLPDAEDAYREHARQTPGVTGEWDLVLLTSIGLRLGSLAKHISASVALSHGVNKRPTGERLAVLMVEALDGEIEPEAWAVVQAAALHAASS